MESLELNLSSFAGKRVLVTGHAGFKGYWLCKILEVLGARTFGVSDLKNVHLTKIPVEQEQFFNLCDAEATQAFFAHVNPDIVFHLAAQSLVGESYINPSSTWHSNVIATLNVLESIRKCPNVSGAILVSTDKCYENVGWDYGYREIDKLGGIDPYSASKAAMELLVASHRESFFMDPQSTVISTVRAGNVLGGGDWEVSRLIPSIYFSRQARKPLEVRSPNATRPWQHVLDCLYGYMKLADFQIKSPMRATGAWNFGPAITSNITVSEILQLVALRWPEVQTKIKSTSEFREHKVLNINSDKAYYNLAWKNVLSIEDNINLTLDWYENWSSKQTCIASTQVERYLRLQIENG